MAQSVQSVQLGAVADSLQECVSQDFTVRDTDSSFSLKKKEGHPAAASRMKEGHPAAASKMEKGSFCISFKN